MKGIKEDSEKCIVCLAVLDSEDRTVFTATHHPQPINSEKWGAFCLREVIHVKNLLSFGHFGPLFVNRTKKQYYFF